uniref:Retrotransposon Copia-like N-terminal domain-containing protein n=1 Tax=Fagus sylvatica TaxID=28930 RepID=A0A2N9GLS4_FAGSY
MFISAPLNEENYATWGRAMLNALNAKNKTSFVDGALCKPDENSPDVHAWVKCNSMVISWLINSLTRDLHESVAYADTAREIWIDLEERFSQGNAPRIHELKRDLSLLLQEEKQQALASARTPTIEATALAAKGYHPTSRMPSFNQRGPTNSRSRDRCDHCKKPGHTKDRCFAIIGYPAHWRTPIRSDSTKNLTTWSTREFSSAATSIKEPTTDQSPIAVKM